MFPTDFNTSPQAGPERGAAESHPPTIDLPVSPSLLLSPHGQCSGRQASALHYCCHRMGSVRVDRPQPFTIVVTAGTVFEASTFHYCCHRRDSVRGLSPSLLLSPQGQCSRPQPQTPNTGLRHHSFKVPEIDARSVPQPFTIVVTAGAVFGSIGLSPSLLLSPQVAALHYCCHRRGSVRVDKSVALTAKNSARLPRQRWLMFDLSLRLDPRL